MIPLIDLIWKLAFALLAVFVLLVALRSKEQRAVHTGDFSTMWKAILGTRLLFYKVSIYLIFSAILLSRLGSLLGESFDHPALTEIGEWCHTFSWVLSIAVLVDFFQAAQQAAQQHQGQRLRAGIAEIFGPNIMSNITYNNSGNMALGTHLTGITQNASGNSLKAQQVLYPFIELVINELKPPRQNEVLYELSTITDESSRPPERRDRPRILAAMERVTGLISGVSSLVEAWSKVVPVIKSLFNN